MRLPLTSEEWMTDSATWHKKHEEKRIIDVVSPENDKTEAYYFEGTKLYKVRTDESYDREDRAISRQASAETQRQQQQQQQQQLTHGNERGDNELTNFCKNY
jgi:hypothetical protein